MDQSTKMNEKDEKLIENHAFNIDDAVKYGVDAAIILYNMKFWLDHNIKAGINVYDGYVWTYNSAKTYEKTFPYFDKQKIGRILRFLEDEGAIKSGNYNKLAYDKTKWYTIVQFCTIDASNMNNRELKNEQPIPDIITDINTNSRDTYPEYLLNLSESELKYLNRTYRATPVEIAKKAESLYNWCLANGKKYKMYRPFLKNALEKDYGKRIIRNNPATL